MSARGYLSWKPQTVELPFSIGEIRLFTMRFNGIGCEPDIFSVPKLSCAEPPISDLRDAKRKVAYIYSCPLENRLPTFSLVGRYIRYVSEHYRHFYVHVDGDFKNYLARLKKKTLSTLTRKLKKAESSNKELGLFAAYGRLDEMDDFFEAAIPISKRSYQHTLLGQGLPDSSAFRERIKNKAAQGRVKGFLLFVEDTPAAYNLCPVYGEKVILYDHTGYDPQYSKYSPGTVLQYKIIESLFESGGLDYYDLCTGEGRHKELFGTGFTLCANVYFFPLTPHHLAFVWLRIVVDQTVSISKSVLNRFGLKDRLKKAIRRKWR